MKKSLFIIAAIILMAGLTTKVMAQDNTKATLTGTAAGAVLIIPMAIYEDSPLHFGCLTLINTTGGTCVLATDNTRTFPSAGVKASLSLTPPSTNAAYHVTGTNNENYALTLPATTTVTTAETGTVKTMDITLMTVKFLGQAEETYVGATSTLSAAGTDSFIVGGTLTVKADQIGGVYAGIFNVTVDYN